MHRDFSYRTWVFGAIRLVLVVICLVQLSSTFALVAASEAKIVQPQIEKMEPLEVARGGAIKFTGKDFPADTKDITVCLNGKDIGNALDTGPDPGSNNTKSVFRFIIPDGLPLGKYNVRVKFTLDGTKSPLPVAPNDPRDAALTVLSESGNVPLKITAVSPLLSYPSKSMYGFDLLGEGFSVRGTDNVLVINNREVQVCWEDDPACNQKDTKLVHGKVVSDRQLTFYEFSRETLGIGNTLGKATVQVRVGHVSSKAENVTLSPVGKATPIMISVLIFIVVFGVVIYLSRRGAGTTQVVGIKYGILTTLLLDKETNSYSLARFQFFVWTGAAIVGYLYLMLSRSLVQGKLDFIDIPSSLPGIILISASTSVFAQMVANEKGPKGAGNVQPSFADLISVGGVVVVERFQFFVWTK